MYCGQTIVPDCELGRY